MKRNLYIEKENLLKKFSIFRGKFYFAGFSIGDGSVLDIVNTQMTKLQIFLSKINHAVPSYAESPIDRNYSFSVVFDISYDLNNAFRAVFTKNPRRDMITVGYFANDILYNVKDNCGAVKRHLISSGMLKPQEVYSLAGYGLGFGYPVSAVNTILVNVSYELNNSENEFLNSVVNSYIAAGNGFVIQSSTET